jgi:hypothetical protein
MRVAELLTQVSTAAFNGAVPNVIEVAATGRAKCRACGRAIAKGDFRFGEAIPNAYGEGETSLWFHLVCAACTRPEPMRETLKSAVGTIPERDWLEHTADVGIVHRRLPRMVRAERASSGRARCRHCRDLIEKGVFRIALQIFEEGRMSPMGTIHVKCAPAYFGTADIVPRIERLSPELALSELKEIAAIIRDAPAPTAEASPGVAKARPSENDALEAEPAKESGTGKPR